MDLRPTSYGAQLMTAKRPWTFPGPLRNHDAINLARGDNDMSSLSLRKKLFDASALAGLMAVVAVAPGLAQQKATPPDFSGGWIGLNGGGPFFEPVPGVVPGPVTQDPAHPFVPNG